MEKSKNQESNEHLCEVFHELKSLQDYLVNSTTKYFGKILTKLVGVDTIPFYLLTKKGLLTLSGIDRNEKTGKEEKFKTHYFRIESIDEETCSISVSLLRPFDVYGNDAYSVCEVMKLKKTPACEQVELSDIFGIQLVEVELLKRKIIIEPK